MGLLPLFDDPSVKGAIAADLRGRPLEPPVGSLQLTEKESTATAAAMHELAAAGSAVGLTHLEAVLVKGPSQAILTAVQPDALLMAVVDPSNGTSKVEKVLRSWSTSPASPEVARPASAETSQLTPPPLPISRLPSSSPADAGETAPSQTDEWVGLRRALVRGQLTEAVARQSAIRDAPAGARPQPGAERLEASERDRITQVLLDGIGSVMAGDSVGAGRILQELAASPQPNLSFRWLALHWSARAALKGGDARAARPQVKESLSIAKQLGVEAQAVSQWVAGELLAQGTEPAQALAWLKSSRALFSRLGDSWGVSRTWMVEARVLACLEREEECVAAAQQAWTADVSWDEPPLFLARRALKRDDLAGSESFLRTTETPAASRLRSLVEAIRSGTVSRASASEFLREEDAPPSPKSARALEAIAAGAPNFFAAHEALAWTHLKLGNYAAAESTFQALLSRQLSASDRASVLLGIGCIAHAVRPGKAPGKPAGVAAKPERAPSSANGVPGSASGSQPNPSTTPARGFPADGGPSAVFSGRLSAFALPDLLEFLRGARRTGLLVCTSTAGIGTLRFRNGRITNGTSPATPRIGDILLRNRKVSPVALRAIAAQDNDCLLGTALVRAGAADAASVQEALSQQIEMAIRELFHWKDGEFVFNHEAESPDAGPNVMVELDPQAVLLQLLKDMDEASRAPAALGSAR